MPRVYAYVSRRPSLLIACLLVLLGVAAVGALRLDFEEDIFALLPADEPLVAESRLALQRYRGLERVVIAVESDDPATLSRAVQTLEPALAALDGVDEVVARLDEQAQTDIAALYAGAAPLLFDRHLQQQINERLTAEVFAERLQRFVDAQAGAQGIAVIDNFRADPFGFDELVYRRFERLNSGFAGRTDARGHVLSRDGRFAVVFVQPAFIASDTGTGREFMQQLDQTLAELPDGVTAHVVGAHRSSVDNAVVLRRDILLTIATSVAAIVLLFLLVFRSLLPMSVPLLAVGFGFAMALGAQGFARGEISAITVGFAAVLLGIAVDYSIHLVTTFGSLEGERDARARDALAHVARPATAAMVTTVAAVFMLRFSRFDGLHQLAEMAIAGLAGSLVFALTAGAQLLRVAGPKAAVAGRLDGLMLRIEKARERMGNKVFALAVLVSVPLGLMANSVGFDGDVMNLDGKSARTVASEHALQEAFGQETFSRTLVVSGGNDLQQALRAGDIAADALHRTGARHEGLSWTLPAVRTQQENLERWRRAFTPERVDAIVAMMAQATATRADTGTEVRFTPQQVEARFGEFLGRLRLTAPPAPLDAEVLKQRPVWTLFQGFVSGDGGRVYVASTAVVADEDIATLKARAPHALVLNKASFVSRMVQFIRRDLLLTGGMALLLVALVAWAAFRRLADALVALMPVVLALVWTLGLMSILGIPFNIINTLVAVFVAGLGIDYGIFMVQTWRSSKDADEARRRMRHAGAGILVAALTTLCGFGSLALAGHPALFSVGVTTAIGVMSALAVALFVVPAMLSTVSPKEPA